MREAGSPANARRTAPSPSTILGAVSGPQRHAAIGLEAGAQGRATGGEAGGESSRRAPGPAAQAATRPRWYRHDYNRASLYRLAEVSGWIPRRLRLALARHLGRMAPRFLPAERATIRDALRRITGASGARLEALADGVFRDFAMCFSDLVSTNRQPARRLLGYVDSVTGGEQLEGLGGLVSVTAHVGNWEMAGRLLARRTTRRTHVVVAPEAVPALERWVRRDGEGMRFVPRTHPRIGVELLAALRRGEVVALQGDRALGDRSDVEIPFFGHPARFPLGPFLLARAAGVPVVPAFCMLGPGYRYHVRIAPPIEARRGAEEVAAGTWVALLESVVREHPTQWFNFFDVWRKPAGPGPGSRRTSPGP
jgi:lauroyl/myristoyl acyltransferase